MGWRLPGGGGQEQHQHDMEEAAGQLGGGAGSQAPRALVQGSGWGPRVAESLCADRRRPSAEPGNPGPKVDPCHQTSQGTDLEGPMWPEPTVPSVFAGE